MVLERDVQQSHMGVIFGCPHTFGLVAHFTARKMLKFELYFVQIKVNKLSDFIENVNIIGSPVGFRFLSCITLLALSKGHSKFNPHVCLIMKN